MKLCRVQLVSNGKCGIQYSEYNLVTTILSGSRRITKTSSYHKTIAAVFFYIFAITARFHIFCKPRCKPVNQMNETVKALCYKSKTLSNGEHPLMLCVCKDNKRKYQSLGISVNAELGLQEQSAE